MNGECIGISRTHQYYQHKQPTKDWKTKQMIEDVLREHPSYGHKRIAKHLCVNKKRVLRVMKPYRRTTKKRFVKRKQGLEIPNYLLTETPRGQGDIYVSDFTYINFQKKWI